MLKRISMALALLCALLPAVAHSQTLPGTTFRKLTLPTTDQGSAGAVDGFSVKGVKLPAALAAPSLARSAIAASSASAVASTIVTSGYSTVGDRGTGCTYVRGASSGPGAVQDALSAWWQLPNGVPLDVTCFGAKMDGTTDDTAAFQAAINAATGQSATGGLGRVTVPPGTTVLCQINVKGNLSIQGAGSNVSVIRPCSATTNVFTSTAADTAPTFNLAINGFTIQSADGGTTQQTGGAAFYMQNCQRCNFNDNSLVAQWVGYLLFGGQSSFIYIERNHIVAFKNRGIIVNGGLAKRFFNNLIDGGWGDPTVNAPQGQYQANACIEMINDGGSFIANNDMQKCGNVLLLDPNDGQNVSYLTVTSGYADTATGNGVLLNPTGTGRIDNIRFTQFWTSTMKGSGISSICTTGGASGQTGQVNNVTVTDHAAQNNAYSGIAWGCGTNLRVRGGTFYGNNYGGNNGASGVTISAGVSHFSVQNIDCSFPSKQANGTPLFTVNQVYCINVAPGASDYYIVQNNDGIGGTTSGTTFLDGGTGTHKYVTPNF